MDDIRPPMRSPAQSINRDMQVEAGTVPPDEIVMTAIIDESKKPARACETPSRYIDEYTFEQIFRTTGYETASSFYESGVEHDGPMIRNMQRMIRRNDKARMNGDTRVLFVAGWSEAKLNSRWIYPSALLPPKSAFAMSNLAFFPGWALSLALAA